MRIDLVVALLLVCAGFFVGLMYGANGVVGTVARSCDAYGHAQLPVGIYDCRRHIATP